MTRASDLYLYMHQRENRAPWCNTLGGSFNQSWRFVTWRGPVDQCGRRGAWPEVGLRIILT